MNIFKASVKFILRKINADLEHRMVNQDRFNRLKRKAPQLQWQALKSAPVALYDAGAAQIGHRLFIFGGALWMKGVEDKIYILDLEKGRWSDGGRLSADMPQSHSAIVSDQKRFIYFLSGQIGHHCSPATKKCFVYDTLKKSWATLPSMPYARYAATAQLWRGRLHVLGGSKEDRNAPAQDHCSIAVDDGRALEETWRQEPEIPRGGGDRASMVMDDQLFVFGGQEGDWIAIPGDPQYRCTPDLTTEIMYADTYRLKAGASQWERLADMPVPTSHTEFAVFQLDKKIILVGGQHDRKERTTYMTDVIQAYEPSSDSWQIIGRLPYGSKTISVYYNGWLYFTSGQRDKGPGHPEAADSYDCSLWRARFDLNTIVEGEK